MADQETPAQTGAKPKRRSGPRSRSSPFKGVTQYRRTGKWEAHLWCPNPRGRGFQRHLGSYHTAEDAAHAFDRATIRVRGTDEELNFPVDSYRNDPFMLEHAKTDKVRFLELLRERFAIQSEAKIVRRPLPPARTKAVAAAFAACKEPTEEDEYDCDQEEIKSEGGDSDADEYLPSGGRKTRRGKGKGMPQQAQQAQQQLRSRALPFNTAASRSPAALFSPQSVAGIHWALPSPSAAGIGGSFSAASGLATPMAATVWQQAGLGPQSWAAGRSSVASCSPLLPPPTEQAPSPLALPFGFSLQTGNGSGEQNVQMNGAGDLSLGGDWLLGSQDGFEFDFGARPSSAGFHAGWAAAGDHMMHDEFSPRK